MLETCYQYERIEAGCDEAGRGRLAGAVFAAAVILPPDFHDPLLNDSKQMSERNRDRLRPIIEREAVAWAVAMPSRPNAIDRNQHPQRLVRRHVTRRRRNCGHETPNCSLIDGNRFRSSLDIPYRCIVKGDATYAPTSRRRRYLPRRYRDEYMRRLAEEFPQVRLGEEQGLPYARTPSRREALRGDALSPADVQSRIGTAGTFLIGSAGDVRLPYFIVFRGIGQTDDRRGNADAIVFARLCCVAASARGAERDGCGRGRRDGFHRRKAGLCARSEFGCGRARRSAGIRPLRVAEQSSTGFEPLRSGPREFFRTMVRM